MAFFEVLSGFRVQVYVYAVCVFEGAYTSYILPPIPSYLAPNVHLGMNGIEIFHCFSLHSIAAGEVVCLKPETFRKL